MFALMPDMHSASVTHAMRVRRGLSVSKNLFEGQISQMCQLAQALDSLPRLPI
jgi:hypothetical protein